MVVVNVAELVNNATKEVTGEIPILEEDLSNVVDVGNAIIDNNAVDPYSKSLINVVGKQIFVNRTYNGAVPSVIRNDSEYGSIIQKVSANLPIAQENESWNLNDGQSYDPNVFVKPTVQSKFFNKRVSFEVQLSVTDYQIRQSFLSPTNLSSFISMLFNNVEKSMTIKLDGLVMRTINNFIGETLYNDYQAAGFNTKSGVRAVNLLYNYNQKFTKTLTAVQAISDPDFIRYACFIMNQYVSRMTKISKIFNIGGLDRFTPTDMLHVLTLAEFDSASKIYLQSDTYHKELVELPNSEIIPFWQGSGTDYDFTSTSAIHVNTVSNHEIEASGILAVMFDRDALGVNNFNRRVTSNYNPKAEFTNYFYKSDANYFNDLNENFVVFFVA